MFDDVEKNFFELEALEKCKKWRKIRKWLYANSVNFNTWPQEIEYHKLVKKFDWEKRAKMIEIIVA